MNQYYFATKNKHSMCIPKLCELHPSPLWRNEATLREI